jgi:cell division protein FtsA
MRNEPIVAVEIGTSTIRAVAAESEENGGCSILALAEIPSRGVRKGEVSSLKDLSVCIDAAIRKIEPELERPVRRVVVALSGSRVSSRRSTGRWAVDGEITEEDCKKARDDARNVPLPPGQVIMRTVFRTYRVDGVETLNPVGLEGAVLEADMLVVHTTGTHCRTVVGVFKDLDLDVEDIYFSGLCAATSVLSPAQKHEGVALLDLGAGTTDYVLYADQTIADAGSLPVGGDHVTNDIARAFRLTTEAARNLKHSHGQAMIQATGRTNRIQLPVEPEAPPRVAILSDLETVIHVRMEETFQLIRDRLRSGGFRTEQIHGLVLTGGGSCLPGVSDLAERVFGLHCDIGAPVCNPNLSDAYARPDYATIVGAVERIHRERLHAAESRIDVVGAVKRWFGLKK